MKMTEMVIIVDENDNELDIQEKIKAHKEGTLHRAFSVFVFNSKGEMLLQKRSINKYHSGGLWTNTCCSHPRPGEAIEDAAKRRLNEEMGFYCDLKEVFHFVYNVEFENGLTEHEFDHVFICNYDGPVEIDPNDADDFKWMDLGSIREDIEQNPEYYTEWFKIGFDKLSDYLSQN
jgi:isopentenyl-diphosphate delta-isomerase